MVTTRVPNWQWNLGNSNSERKRKIVRVCANSSYQGKFQWNFDLGKGIRVIRVRVIAALLHTLDSLTQHLKTSDWITFDLPSMVLLLPCQLRRCSCPFSKLMLNFFFKPLQLIILWGAESRFFVRRKISSLKLIIYWYLNSWWDPDVSRFQR